MAAGLGSSRLLFGLVEGPVLVSAADGPGGAESELSRQGQWDEIELSEEAAWGRRVRQTSWF